MLAVKPGDLRTSASGTVSISFDVSCGATEHTIQYAELTRENLGAHNWIGQHCDVGVAGTYDWSTTGTPATMFFVLVANNGSEEGSYGQSSLGFERSEDMTSLECPMVQNLQYVCE